MDAANVVQNRLYWRVDGWEVWDKVQTAWEATAGPDVKVVFLEEKGWLRENYAPLLLESEDEEDFEDEEGSEDVIECQDSHNHQARANEPLEVAKSLRVDSCP